MLQADWSNPQSEWYRSLHVPLKCQPGFSEETEAARTQRRLTDHAGKRAFEAEQREEAVRIELLLLKDATGKKACRHALSVSIV